MIKGFPKEVRASWIARAKWCHYQSRLRACSLATRLTPIYTERTQQGSYLHKLIDLRKRNNESTTRFKAVIASNEPIYRTVLGVKIYAHPDDYWVLQDTKRVRLIEYKTSKQKPTPAQFFPASFQLQIYDLVLKPLVSRLGYVLADEHLLIYYNAPEHVEKLRPIKTYVVEANLEATLDEIRYIFEMWRGRAKPIPPQAWKCEDTCHPLYQRLCPWYPKLKEASGND